MLLATGGLVAAIACASDAPDAGEAAPPRVSPETLARGRELYQKTCAPCHGEQGKGDGPAGRIFKPPPRDHSDATYMNTITDADMEKTIQMGGAIKGKPLMPSHPQIRGDDMTALIAYVRSLSRSTQ